MVMNTGAACHQTRVEVIKYASEYRAAWDAFVRRSKNGTFLFERAYIQYHAARFEDASALVFEGNRLIALFPASRHGYEICSHAGLTYGGLITDERMSASRMVRVFDTLCAFLAASQAQTLWYKPVPHIYHRYPAEEDLYALVKSGATLYSRQVASTVDLRTRPRRSKGRRWSLSRARRTGIVVSRSDDIPGFMRLVDETLMRRYQAKATHSQEEMSLLAGQFPHNIKLYVASRDGTMLGGAIVFDCPTVAHLQYLAAPEEGRQLGALDLIIETLIERELAEMRYFDFGTSMDPETGQINTGLTDNKESYGARTTTYDTYLIRF
ncbi:MAG: hypothetical protein NVSMB52_15490 [Chloroflexota bacterium]